MARATKKGIRIISRNNSNYTFVETTTNDTNSTVNQNKRIRNTTSQKDILKTRSLDSKKTKIKYKNRITGGQAQQGHSSIYE